MDRLRHTGPSAAMHVETHVEIHGRPPRFAMGEGLQVHEPMMLDRTTSARPRRHAAAVRTSASTLTAADMASIDQIRATIILEIRSTEALLTMIGIPQNLCRTETRIIHPVSLISASTFVLGKNPRQTVAATSNEIAV